MEGGRDAVQEVPHNEEERSRDRQRRGVSAEKEEK